MRVRLVQFIVPALIAVIFVPLMPALVRAEVPNVGGVSGFCPTLTRTLQRGMKDSTTGGQVSQLQRFLAARYGVRASDLVTGYFGPTTEGYVKSFQREQGISPLGVVGPQTRAAIARVCSRGGTPPEASSVTMSASPLSGTMPLVVAFTITTTGSCRSYILYFGDQKSQDLPSFCGTRTISHTYTAKGTYAAHLDEIVPTGGAPVHTLRAQSSISVGEVQVVAPTCTMSTTKTNVQPNESFTVTWSSTGATSAKWSGGASTGTSGSAIFADLTTTSTKTITFSGPGGTKSCSVTITVTPPPNGTVNATGNAIANGGVVDLPASGQSAYQLADFSLKIGSQEDILLKKFTFTVRNQTSNSSPGAATVSNYRVTIGTNSYTVSTTKDGVYEVGTVSLGSGVTVTAGATIGIGIFADIVPASGGTIDLWIYPSDMEFTGKTTGTSIKPSSSVTNRVDSDLLYWSGWVSVASKDQSSGGGNGSACYLNGQGYAIESPPAGCSPFDYGAATPGRPECAKWYDYSKPYCTADGWANVSWGLGYWNSRNITVGCTSYNGIYIPGNRRVYGNHCIADGTDTGQVSCDANYVCKRDGWWRVDANGFEIAKSPVSPWVAPETFYPNP